MIKRFIGASLLAITLGFSASASAAVDGDACTFKLAANKIYQTSSTAKFTCTTLFNGEALTINEIYSRGYKVVAFSDNASPKELFIIIEKQK
ncbi:hypothetical protein [Moraxella bovoculi]|uniref:hypothetical protein n=1 Tax=Moraxella bovoculi TaxID=386891 RepID=UPI000624A199|nr:hypothetical protein [Moraxella bovoculi]AKG15226.2 hypothetical protein AAX08_03870 [Moraxella bovoculi]